MIKSKRFFKTAISVALGAAFCLPAAACGGAPAAGGETYEITIRSGMTGGSVTADKTKVAAGEDVVLSLRVDEGMTLQSVTVNGIEVSFYDGEYTLFSVTEDCVIDAKFVSSAAVVKYVTGTDETFAPKPVLLNERVGELPVPASNGARRFLGWYDAEEGGNLIKRSSVVKTNELVLYAHWETLSQEYLDGLLPYSVTNSVYSSQLGAYGISFHTQNAAIDPQILIAETTDSDFSEAVAVECEQSFFYEEYVSQGVIDLDELSLVRGRQYLVKVGDAVTEVYSEPFVFTARKLTEGETKFLYVTDTQQDYHNEFYTDVEGVAYAGGLKNSFAATVVQTAIAHNPDFDFIAHGGDFVNYGAENGYWAEMLGDFAEIMFEYPMVVAAGNHEDPGYYASEKYNLMTKMFKVNMPEFGSGEAETYVKNGMTGCAFSLDAGPVHFVVLNSNDAAHTDRTNAPAAESLSNAQLNWLRADLKADKENGDTKFTVVMIHEGPLVPTHSSNASNDHYRGLRGPLLKELRDGKADLVMCGHNHYAFSSYPIDYDENASTEIEYSSSLTVAEKYAKRVATEYVQESVDGVSYNTFPNYRSGEEGTVMLEVGTSGPQTAEFGFPDSDREALIAKHVFYRFLNTPGKGCVTGFGDTSVQMYNYVKVTDTQLTVETYAMSFNANYNKNFAGGDRPEVRLIDSLLLKK